MRQAATMVPTKPSHFQTISQGKLSSSSSRVHSGLGCAVAVNACRQHMLSSIMPSCRRLPSSWGAVIVPPFWAGVLSVCRRPLDRHDCTAVVLVLPCFRAVVETRAVIVLSSCSVVMPSTRRVLSSHDAVPSCCCAIGMPSWGAWVPSSSHQCAAINCEVEPVVPSCCRYRAAVVPPSSASVVVPFCRRLKRSYLGQICSDRPQCCFGRCLHSVLKRLIAPGADGEANLIKVVRGVNT